MVPLKSALVSLLFLQLLAGCTSFEASPAVQMLHHVVPLGGDTERVQFDPRFHYLRVVVDSRVIFMASDTPDIDTANATGVWYSAGSEVLRFRDGRLVAAVGMAAEWRGVVLPELPGWAVLAQDAAPLRWTRIRDVMPGYRYGTRDALVLRRIAAPEHSRLQGLDPHALVWFEETSGAQDAGAEPLPPARYALDARNNGGKVVYGEQCLSPALCFSWQRWPVQAGKSE